MKSTFGSLGLVEQSTTLNISLTMLLQWMNNVIMHEGGTIRPFIGVTFFCILVTIQLICCLFCQIHDFPLKFAIVTHKHPN